MIVRRITVAHHLLPTDLQVHTDESIKPRPAIWTLLFLLTERCSHSSGTHRERKSERDSQTSTPLASTCKQCCLANRLGSTHKAVSCNRHRARFFLEFAAFASTQTGKKVLKVGRLAAALGRRKPRSSSNHPKRSGLAANHLEPGQRLCASRPVLLKLACGNPLEIARVR